MRLAGVCVSFDGQEFLHDIGLQVAEGEILGLLGPSGCGKTTLLRTIAGLQEMEQGQLFIDEERIDESPAEQRGVGMVFQSPTLFPHLDVAGNLELALPRPSVRDRLERWVRRLGDPWAREQITDVLHQVGLSGFQKRKIETLSGGEAQRVALARALLLKPRLLLLDEPLSALDRTLRNELRRELRTILKRVGVTAVYVTHDQGEAASVADRIALMRRGRILQVDRPDRLYRSPATVWAVRFLGQANLVTCEVLSSDDGYLNVKTSLKGLEELRVASPKGYSEQTPWMLWLGPRALELGRDESRKGQLTLEATIIERELRPDGLRLRVAALCDTEDETVMLSVKSWEDDESLIVGKEVTLTLDPGKASMVSKDE